ncbi:MAG: uroporphyrinogen decarboxylase family protein [Armatimonadota bacterium]|jgi:uroporphyrinogen decarboxylase
MTSRDRITAALRHEEPDRVPMVETHFWPPTIERWRDEGLPADVQPEQFFELDRLPRVGIDCSLQLDEQLLEETDEWTVGRDRDGAVHRRWKHHYATCAEVDQLVKTREDWEGVRDRLQPTPDRLPADLPKRIRDMQAQETFVVLQPAEPVWWVWRTLGMERAFMAMAGDPEWFAEMVAAQTEMQLELLRMALATGARPDGVWYFSDLCYRNGMFFSQRMYRELMLPWHARLADFCHANDLFLLLHCCGDARDLVPHLIDAGFDAIQPLEARCGNDVREMKPLYGDRIALFGNMNMDVFASGDRAAIRDEVLSKLAAAKPGGGYIWHSDHSVPPTVAFEDYAYAVELTREHAAY